MGQTRRKLIETLKNLALSVRDSFALRGSELEERVNQVVQVVAYRPCDEWNRLHGVTAPTLPALFAECVNCCEKTVQRIVC